MKMEYSYLIILPLFFLLAGCCKPCGTASEKPKELKPYSPWRHPAVKAESENPGFHAYEPWRHPATKAEPAS